ncbi:MAG: glutamate-5-semialdehyde dehydrogenase [Planctomycetota bacterium]
MRVNAHGLDIDAICRQARAAARAIEWLSSQQRRDVLYAMSEAINAQSSDILAANARDVTAGESTGLSPAMLDRLRLDDDRLHAMTAGVRAVADLPDPLHIDLNERIHANGMRIRRVAVPLGVIAMIYESRPNVTADAGSLCFKAGNAVILKGGSEALESNRAILQAMEQGGVSCGMPAHAMQLLDTRDRSVVHDLLQRYDTIDLVIPRGGEGLIRAVAGHATMPVLKHYKGICHVYVDVDADLEMALNIVENGKVQRPGVCNATETVLVHESIADAFLPRLARRLAGYGVELRGDARTCAVIPDAIAAHDDDWSAEYLDLILSIRVVSSADAAMDHIDHHGSRHSDVIVSENAATAQRFLRGVDSAAVYVNASSRFTDGAEFGLGAEIGISTDKVHARGPCGIESLTSYKYIIEGRGQIRP